MKTIEIVHTNLPCSLAECPPGFFLYEWQLCFKSEYKRDGGKLEAFNSAGKCFCALDTVEVWPVDFRVNEE